MKTYKVSRGYDIPIQGEPEQRIDEGFRPKTVGVCPNRFHGIKPRLDVAVGDSVKVGSTLFHDKTNPEIRFASPAAGKIAEIKLGPRRVIEEIQISSSGVEFEQFENFRTHEIGGQDRGKLIDLLLKAGVWPFIRQRPFSRIATPTDTPSSLFINCMDTAPLASDPAFVLQGKEEEFKAGVEACKVLSPNGVHLVVDGNAQNSFFQNVEGVEKHAFTGKHPAGLVGTHIHEIDPLGPHTKVVWYLNARDVVALGSFLLIGQYPTDRVVAITGTGAKKRRLVRTQLGVRLSELLEGETEDDVRFVSGNVLTGAQKNADGFLDFYDDQVTVIPEGREQYFMGWLVPGLWRWTYHRAYASALLPGKKFAMHTNTNGEERAFVKTGDYEKVVAIDVLPDFLCKAILANDIDLMEQLGILECDVEDFALCSYISISKIEFTEIIKKGLDMMEAEISAPVHE